MSKSKHKQPTAHKPKAIGLEKGRKTPSLLVFLIVISLAFPALYVPSGTSWGIENPASAAPASAGYLGLSGAAPSVIVSSVSQVIGIPGLRDVWVDPVHGSDGNGGGSREQALQTVSAAWGLIPSGTTLTVGYRILLVSGDYPESGAPGGGWMASRYGTDEFPVIFQASDGMHTARLHWAANIYDCRYLLLVNLDFVTDLGQNGGGDVVHIASSDHVFIYNSKLDGFDGRVQATQETLKVNQSQYIYVINSTIAGAFWFPVDFVSVQYGAILNSTIHNAGDDCMVVKGGSAYIHIEGNDIYDCAVLGFSAGQGTGFNWMVSPWLHYEIYATQFVNNVVHDTQFAGVAVTGGYNVLIAYNTFYRVGIDTNVGAALMEIGHGSRGCDGDTPTCLALHNAGGWGPPAAGDGGEWIPNKHVYVYNNIFYNPSPARTMWSHFGVAGPVSPPTNTNIPSPSTADYDLRIRGNIVWNGPANLPIGVGDSGQGCQPSNPTCNAAQITSDNAINTIQPQLQDAAHGNFHPVSGGTVYSATLYPLPDFTWTDSPATPQAPSGNLSNSVPNDRDGQPRAQHDLPGAYASTGPVPTPFAFSISNSGTITATQGASGANTITLTLNGGTAQSVALSCSSGLPTGATCSFNPATVSPPGSSTLTIRTSTTTPTGNSLVVVTSTAGTLSHTTQVALTVLPKPQTVSITVSYSVLGGGTPTAPVLNYVQLRVAKTYTITTSPTTLQADLNSAWSVTNPLAGSTSSERWATSQATSGTLSAAKTVAFPYQHQYWLTVQATPSNGGTTTPTSGWQTVGITVVIGAISKTNYTFKSWTGSGTGSYTGTSASSIVRMSAPITETATFVPALTVKLTSPTNGATIKVVTVTLTAQVTFAGSPVQGATVAIYAGGRLACSGTTNSQGYITCNYTPPLHNRTYTWYATAAKTGYQSATSPTWSFIYK